MSSTIFEVRHFDKNGLPCFCHLGYIGNKDTPHRPNWHKDIEILLCSKGEGFVEYDDQTVNVAAGDMIVVNSGIAHRILTHSYVEYWFLIIDAAFQAEHGFPAEKTYFTVKLSDRALNKKFMEIVDITHSEDRFRILKTRIACAELILMLLENYSTLPPADAENTSAVHIKKALEFIQYRFSHTITVADIASYIGISQSRLAKEFKQHTGHSVLEQINIIRCKQARALILQNEKISLAAESCGFDNLSYFTKTYKKYIGELPSETKNKLSRP